MKVNRDIIKTFEDWCDKSPNEGDRIPEGTSHEEIKDQIARASAETVLSIEGLPVGWEDVLTEAKLEFGHVLIVGDGKTCLKICDARIRNLEVHNVGKQTFWNCEIGKLVTEGVNPDYQIINCKIGCFRIIKKYSVQRLEWNGGYLGQFSLDRPLDEAFVGDAWFHNVELPRDAKKRDVQWLRDTRAALVARSNTIAAGFFHARELTITRPREHWTFKLASYGYEWGSNFGNSIARPLVVISVIFALLVALALAFGTDPTREDPQLHGWQKGLLGESCSARWFRALLYAGQSINPFSLFESQRLVVMRDIDAAFWGGFLGTAGVAAVALFALSLRRHFKLE